jgi:hypothetical protein
MNLVVEGFMKRYAKENGFQADMIKELETRYEGSLVLKNDPNYIQGIPDLIILYMDKWAVLECKRSAHEHHQPNQDLYISRMDEMSFVSFVYPENKEDVLDELEQALCPRRKARCSKS